MRSAPFSLLLLKEVADANKGRAGLSGSAKLTFEDVGERYLSFQHLVEVETVHTDDALVPPEGNKGVICETAVADEKASGPGRLLLSFCRGSVQLGDNDGRAVPFGLEQVSVTSKQKATIDLFTSEPERLLGRQGRTR